MYFQTVLCDLVSGPVPCVANTRVTNSVLLLAKKQQTFIVVVGQTKIRLYIL